MQEEVLFSVLIRTERRTGELKCCPWWG